MVPRNTVCWYTNTIGTNASDATFRILTSKLGPKAGLSTVLLLFRHNAALQHKCQNSKIEQKLLTICNLLHIHGSPLPIVLSSFTAVHSTLLPIYVQQKEERADAGNAQSRKISVFTQINLLYLTVSFVLITFFPLPIPSDFRGIKNFRYSLGLFFK
jgi:hypothetical protein